MKTRESAKYAAIFLVGMATTSTAGKIIDHRNTVLNSIPASAIDAAKDSLHVAYGHTSHGSQLLSGNGAGDLGLNKLRNAEDVFVTSSDGRDGTLHLLEGSGYDEGGDLVGDAGWDLAGAENRLRFVSETRKFLGTPDARGRGSRNLAYNVVMWSWCGQASWHGDSTMKHYLDGMDSLEREYPGVAFVYMTGHLDGTGTDGQLHRANERIRAFVRDKGKWLFDFADIESYDPDGNEFLSKLANDNGDYDSDGDGSTDANWASEWTRTHASQVNAEIEAAHSQPLVGQLKTIATWWMFCSMAGWNAPPASVHTRRRIPSPSSEGFGSRDVLGRTLAAPNRLPW